MKRLVFALLLAFTASAQAVTTSFYDVTTTWQDIGAGPVQFQVPGGSPGVVYFIGDAAPAAGAPGFLLAPQQPSVAYGGVSHVYVRALSPNGARVVYGPATGIAAAGGTSSLPPQPVTMIVTNNAVTGNAAAVTPLGTNTSRKYLNVFNSTGGACRYGYGSGSTNAAPTATAGMPLPASVGFTLEASAITYQSMSFWCAQTGTIDITEGQ